MPLEWPFNRLTLFEHVGHWQDWFVVVVVVFVVVVVVVVVVVCVLWFFFKFCFYFCFCIVFYLIISSCLAIIYGGK